MAGRGELLGPPAIEATGRTNTIHEEHDAQSPNKALYPTGAVVS